MSDGASTNKEGLKERMEHAERMLRDAAKQTGTPIMGGQRRVFSDPKDLEGIADILKEARDEL